MNTAAAGFSMRLGYLVFGVRSVARRDVFARETLGLSASSLRRNEAPPRRLPDRFLATGRSRASAASGRHRQHSRIDAGGV